MRAGHSAIKRNFSLTTPGGVSLPAGWNFVRTDTFGTGGSVADYTQLHTLYNEGQYYNSDYQGHIVSNPINSQQQTYQNFETSIVFSTDHLTIQGRGQVSGVIQSAQMSSLWSDRSFVYEARFQTPSTLGTWLEFWAYPIVASGADASELDVEIVVSIAGPEDSHQVFFANHGGTQSGNISGGDPNFAFSASGYVDFPNRYMNAAFNASTGPHYYTILYDDTGPGTIKRYLDGILMYTATWKWMDSLGGTGFGPDGNATIDLAAGGGWPGTIASPASWTGDLNIYSMSYYTKRAIPVGKAWNQGHKSGGIQLDTSTSLTATKMLISGTDETVYSTAAVSAGLYYWEVVATGTIASLGVGIGTNTASIYPGRYLGMDPSTLGWFGGGGVFTNNGNLATVAAFTSGARLCFALDLTNHKLWCRVGTAGNWNNDVIGNQNPATNTGGLALPAGLQTLVGPAAGLHTAADSVVGVFASGSWAGTPPSGFAQF